MGGTNKAHLAARNRSDFCVLNDVVNTSLVWSELRRFLNTFHVHKVTSSGCDFSPSPGRDFNVTSDVNTSQ